MTGVQTCALPIPRALLPITGAPPGAIVTVDDRPVGTSALDGTLLVGDLDPGNHIVIAKRDGYLPGRWETKLGLGRGAVLRATMQRAPAGLRIEVAPRSADTKVTIRRLGQFGERVLTDLVLQLAEGEYTVTAVDARGQRRSTHVRLEAGKETTTTLTLGTPPV